MRSYNRLEIRFDSSIETFLKLTELFGLKPIEDNISQYSENIPSSWIHEVTQLENDPYYDFINNFLNILEPKFPDLYRLNINHSDITFWHLYEYDQQCNMEFDPVRLKRLGDNNITLCISCWEGGEKQNNNK
jgi:hypothetical protein